MSKSYSLGAAADLAQARTAARASLPVLLSLRAARRDMLWRGRLTAWWLCHSC